MGPAASQTQGYDLRDASDRGLRRMVTVKLPKRLDLDRDAERVLDSVPVLIVANWVEGRLE